jgi:hypothetical protein
MAGVDGSRQTVDSGGVSSSVGRRPSPHDPSQVVATQAAASASSVAGGPPLDVSMGAATRSKAASAQQSLEDALDQADMQLSQRWKQRQQPQPQPQQRWCMKCEAIFVSGPAGGPAIQLVSSAC